MDTLKTCKAKSKQSKQRCKNFAVRGREVCHIHGGKTPRQNLGPKTEAGRQRQKMASWKDGRCSKEAVEERKEVRKLIRTCRNLLSRHHD